MKTIVLSTALLAACATGCDADGGNPLLDESLANFADRPTDHYEYARYFQSWTGFWQRTTVTVSAGVVVTRSYEEGDETGGTDAWIETGAEIGSHDQGYPARTFPELHDDCEEQVLSQDPEENTIVLELDEDGLLWRCQYTINGCEDDCTYGIAIEYLYFISAK